MSSLAETVQIPGGGMAVRAVYTDPVIVDYRGNPLIEALPPIQSKESAYRSLMNLPALLEHERELEPQFRFHCVLRLKTFFQPLPRHLDLEQRLSRVIREGYLARNPLRAEYARRLQNGYKIIQSGHYDVSYQDVPSTSAGFTIIGVSGMGKTTALERVLKMYPQVIAHSTYQDHPLSMYQVTWLKLDCPHDGSIKGLCVAFFRKVDELLGSNNYQKFGSPRQSVDMMMAHMQQIANSINLGVLVIDEIQHLSHAKSGGAQQMLNFFVTLVNTIGVPVVLIGTPKAMSVLQSEFRQARRGSGQGDMIWERLRFDKEWDLFVSGLWRYSWLETPPELTDGFKQVLYDESQGILDVAVKLFMLSQLRLIGRREEVLTPEFISKVAKEDLQLIQPMIRALRSGKYSEIMQFDDIRPMDVSALVEQHRRELDYREAIRLAEQPVRDQATGRREELRQSVVPKLTAVGIPVQAAEKAVENVLSEVGPYVDEQTLVTEALQLAIQGRRKIKSRNQRKTNSFEQQISDPRDLRVIVSEGRKAKRTAEQALIEAGYNQDPLKDEVLQLW
ncbi:MAG: ATP-binding protein [Alicyclobacillus macrosporangiidus]|uniref:ATP-binding protein n=1 Tax=Alicyclobacillus macrosporangiidus TaxID=392015 RepID=UPI0026EDF267|nr:ATP-binding protein [Alicyclobacillus macrosporangiidus]MCL6598519.1 ATP-binding protein [Alicyclobacillus macrosporangiidus]